MYAEENTWSEKCAGKKPKQVEANSHQIVTQYSSDLSTFRFIWINVEAMFTLDLILLRLFTFTLGLNLIKLSHGLAM